MTNDYDDDALEVRLKSKKNPLLKSPSNAFVNTPSTSQASAKDGLKHIERRLAGTKRPRLIPDWTISPTHFRFDNAADRGERNTTDYSAAIAWVFKSFEIKNCQLCYSIEYNECIYEMLVGFRELCKSRTYMSNKSK
ncbi:hypothetical protein HUJ05_007676 [Dendroctonus ponderosae]|nr:hypothetical protein HUJ05_007676 [Dendroctonus ponderosae]